MSSVVIYTTRFCPFCVRAKQLLAHKGVAYDEIDVTMHPDARRAMTERANGGYTVPQIFIGEHHVGGCNELFAMERAGDLDPLLAANG